MKDLKLNKAMIATILALAWPTMLEELLQTAVQYIDTAMVGSLGTAATAAVGATTTVNWLIGSTVSALGVGFLSYIAKSCGAGNRQTVNAAMTQLVMVVGVVGVAFTGITLGLSGMIPRWMQVDPAIQSLAAKYFFVLYLPMLPRTAIILFGTALRAAGDTKTPMKVGLLVNCINVVLNFALIYPARYVNLFGFSLFLPGAGMGVIGAAAASAIAFTIGGICMTVIVWRHPVISPKGGRYCPDGTILKPCLKVATPNMLQRFGTCLGYVAFAAMINSLGEVATAAHTVANTVESAFYIPGYGMQSAAATLAGNACGAKDTKRLKELTRMFIPIEVALMVISGGALFAFAEPLVGMFSRSAAVIALGTTVLRMVAVTEPFYGVTIILEGMMQGVGNTKKPFIFMISGMWGVRILGTFICTQILHYGLVAAWGCMIAHNMLIFVLFLVSYIRSGWNPMEVKRV